MPAVLETRTARLGAQSEVVTVFRLDKSWSHSPKVGGVLKLRQNPYTLFKGTAVEWRRDLGAPGQALSPSPSISDPRATSARDRAYAQAYARFRGKLYNGSASLGVSLGSVRQSRDMINTRVDTLRSEVPQLYADALRSKRKGKDASGLILETMFGWVPLYSDIHSAATSVIQKADGLEFVRGAGYAEFSNKSSRNTGFYKYDTTLDGSVRCSLAAQVKIVNPNTWLAERAGLLNYAAVAWDLVPWSFMVNAFSNTGSIVNSLTDFAGLSFSEMTETTRFDWTSSNQAVDIFASSAYRGATSRATFSNVSHIRRLVGAPLRPPLVTRVPELNFETAAIGLSLIVQNFGKLRSLYTLGKMSVNSLRKRVDNMPYTE